MSFIRDTRSVEQQQFFSGQRLLHTDLQGIEGFNREMRWLHNQSLHQPGIGNGFAVAGKKGDRSVTIDPGYAIDDQGREIVLTSSRSVPVPPDAGDDGKPKRFLLTVAYPEDADLEVVERRRGLCDDEGPTRLRVEPILCWVDLHPNGTPVNTLQADAIRIGRQLVLAEIAVRDCKLDKDITITQRRNAKPPQQPYIASGMQTPTWRIVATFEQEGEVEIAGGGGEIGEGVEAIAVASVTVNCWTVLALIEGRIDTSSAGFLTAPRYFARLSGERFFPQPPLALVNGGPSHAIIEGLVHIIDPTPAGFTARVMVLLLNNAQWPGGLFHESFDGGMARTPAECTSDDSMAINGELAICNPLSAWSIVWMGVEG